MPAEMSAADGKYSIELFLPGLEGAGIDEILDRHDNLTIASAIYGDCVEQYQGRLVMPYDQARILARNDRPETMPVLSSCRPSAEPRRGAAMAAKAN